MRSIESESQMCKGDTFGLTYKTNFMRAIEIALYACAHRFIDRKIRKGNTSDRSIECRLMLIVGHAEGMRAVFVGEEEHVIRFLR